MPFLDHAGHRAPKWLRTLSPSNTSTRRLRCPVGDGALAQAAQTGDPDGEPGRPGRASLVLERLPSAPLREV
jgi:hypothetical protein